jgi:hypothetical protein
MMPNLVMENTFPGWNDFFQYSSTYFNGPNNSLCDCSRQDFVTRAGKSKIYMNTMVENRYYYDPCQNNSITFFGKFGPLPFRGHWQPNAIPFTTLSSNVPDPKSRFLWSYTSWSDMIQQYLAVLVPKPEFVVINAGLWTSHGLNESVLSNIRQALDEVGMIGIYKTTTKDAADVNGTLMDHDDAGCRILHYCLNLNWTAPLSRQHYWDAGGRHFRSHVNTRFNDEMLDIIKMIRDHSNNKKSKQTDSFVLHF